MDSIYIKVKLIILLNSIFNFIYFFKSKCRYNDIKKYEIKVDIHAAYNPINFTNTKFTIKLMIADIKVVDAISFVFFNAIYIPPYNEIIIFQEFAYSKIGI